MKSIIGLVQKIIGTGDADLRRFMAECTRIGGTPVVRTRAAGKDLPEGYVIVACMGRGNVLRGGTITGVSPTLIEQIRARRAREGGRGTRGRLIGIGDESLKEFVRRCLSAGGTPTIRPTYGKQDLPNNSVIVACLGTKGAVKGGTITGISPELLTQLKERRRGKYKLLLDRPVRRPAPAAPAPAPAPAAPAAPAPEILAGIPEVTPTALAVIERGRPEEVITPPEL
ncbi:MAG: hypothetical protein QW794_02285 [Thermosphaera sp.]